MNHFCTDSECRTTLSLKVFTQRNFVADFLQVHEKQPFCVFESPLGEMYNVHLKAHCKAHNGLSISVN